MNTTMADGAAQRLVAQIGEALFGQPGLTLMELAEKVRGMKSSPGGQENGPWPEIDMILADAYSAGALGLQFEGIARRAAVRAAFAADTSHKQEYLYGSDELRSRVAGERAAYLEGLEEGKLIAARQPVAAAAKDSLTVGGGEAVAWMTHHDEPMLYPTFREAAAYCDDDEPPIPLYAAPPAQAVDLGPVRVLAGHASGRINHAYNGLCPDEVEGHDTRDPDCPVCRALIDSKVAGK